jgi:hypothetical protein
MDGIEAFYRTTVNGPSERLLAAETSGEAAGTARTGSFFLSRAVISREYELTEAEALEFEARLANPTAHLRRAARRVPAGDPASLLQHAG